MRGVAQADYWRLVEQLMLLGLYRAGHDADEQATQPSWGFREGHVTDAQRAATVSIEAPSDVAAMRILLDDLQQDLGMRTVRRPSGAVPIERDRSNEGENCV